jgi:two-component system KDP operon response regulator KdpE
MPRRGRPRESDQKPLVLVVEDDPSMRRWIRLSLEVHDYRVAEAKTAAEGVRRASSRIPDLVLLDLGLPDADGGTVIERVREWSTIPIIVVSGRDEQETKVRALDAGADDYLTKPFGAAELLARARVALRHAAARTDSGLPAVVEMRDDVRVDLVRRAVTIQGKDVHLTRTEYRLLVALLKNLGVVMSHGQLLAQVWGPARANNREYLRVHVMRLRNKLERDPEHPMHLLTEPGIGYRLKLL